MALLQGLLDTDGCVRASDNNIEYTTGSPRLAEDVAFLVQSLGGTARIRTKPTSYMLNGERRACKLAYRMSVILPPEIQPFRLSRKAAIYQPRPKYQPSRAIVDVIPVGRKPAQCITVDAPDGLYVTDHCIVTHNTAQLIALLLQRGSGPTLVICPTSVVGNWRHELARFAPGLRVLVHHGADRASGEELSTAAAQHDVVLSTYSLLHRDEASLTRVGVGRRGARRGAERQERLDPRGAGGAGDRRQLAGGDDRHAGRKSTGRPVEHLPGHQPGLSRVGRGVPTRVRAAHRARLGRRRHARG